MTSDTLWRKIPGGLLILEGIVHLGIAVIAYGTLAAMAHSVGVPDSDCVQTTSLFA